MTQRGGRQPAKYRQVAADLRTRIERGEWAVDTQIPTQQELSDQYGVSLGTVDKALGVLRDLGIVETIQGMGTFVRKPPEVDHASEYEAVMSRMDELAEEVRRLREDVATLKRERRA
jgi:GntR family transcriptional regulator